MHVIYLLNQISLLSIILSTLAFIFSWEINQNIFIIYLVLLLLIRFVKGFLKNPQILYIILFIPLFFSNNFFTFILYLMLSTSSLQIIKNDKLSYYSYIDKFDLGIKVMFFIGSIFLLTVSLDFLNKKIAGFAFVYVITGIILLRNLRHINIDNKSKKLSKYNFIINFSIVIVSTLISIEKLRFYLVRITAFIYQKIVDIFFYLFTWFFVIVGIAFGYISKLLNSRIKDGDIKIAENANGIKKAHELAQYKLKNSPNYIVIVFIIKTMLLLLFAYIIYKIFKSSLHRTENSEFYRDEKEFVYENKMKYNIANRFTSFLKPKNNNEVIRFYYSKLLNRLSKLVEIKYSDTSLSIKNKTDKIIGNVDNQRIRDIYIKARYRDETIDDLTKNSFVSLIKSIKLKINNN